MDQKNIKDLPNEILMNIFEYLNYDDLKDASLVCHHWYNLLHTNIFFPSLSVVKVPDLLEDKDFEFLRKTNFQNFQNWWCYNDEILLNEKCQLFEKISIRSLTISKETIDMENLIKILIKFKNLEELKLRFTDLKKCDKLEEIKINYNLKSLSLLAHSIRSVVFSHSYSLIKILDLFSNLQILKIYDFSLKRHIDFGKTKLGGTLSELHLNPYFASKEDKNVVKFCNLNLKKFRCTYPVLFYSNLEEFIKTQKNLVSLILLDAEFPDEFISKIVENLQNLEELKVKCTLESLFKIMKLTNFKKPELQNKSGSNEVNNIIYELCLTSGNESEILSTFSEVKFPNLTVLDLSNCFEAVTDSLLKVIFKNLTNLLHLNLRNCNKISDKGLTGMNFDNENNEEQGVSIANLKRLRSLNLSGCNITDLSLEFGLKFLELRKINLLSCENVTKKGLEHLGKNCPSLVILVLHSFVEQRELSKIFKRYKKNCKYEF